MASFDESKKVSMDDIESVTGGTKEETQIDSIELWKRGFFSTPKLKKAYEIQAVLNKLGYTECDIHDSIMCRNFYYTKDGKRVTQEKFWRDFDEEFI